MISKVITFCQTDGVANTAGYLWRFCRNLLGLRVSETFFFRCEQQDTPVNKGNSNAPNFKAAANATALKRYGYGRLEYVPYSEWFGGGSTCYLGLMQGRVVSYCWAHTNHFTVDQELGRFALRDDEAWIGPLFIDKHYRGRGIATPQLIYAIQNQTRTGKKAFFTSTNSANHAAMRSVAKAGFVMIGLSRTRKLGKWPISKMILDVSNQDYLREALR